jgi:colicin import membrane protein
MRIDTRPLLVALTLACSVACNKGEEEEAARKAAAAEQEAREAQAKANAAKLEAEQEAATARTARAESRDKLQKDLDAHERKAAHLKEKAAAAKGATKKNADAAVVELDKRRDTAKASLTKLSDYTAAAWDDTREAAEDDVEAVGKAVDSLESTLN